jgi:hypothetical protein
MAQIFSPSANTISRVVLVLIAVTAVGSIGVTYEYERSPNQTRVGVIKEQPVPFSHQHHVRELGIDCRYCHTSVETSSSAGMPSSDTCMSCHSQIWNQSPTLAAVRTSLANAEPLKWERVHDLPDFVYFNHGIHVQKGVGCASCHGRVDLMPLTWKVEPLTMQWCLHCHRHPEEHLRPEEEIFNMAYHLPEIEQRKVGQELVDANEIPRDRLTNCSTCHR